MKVWIQFVLLLVVQTGLQPNTQPMMSCIGPRRRASSCLGAAFLQVCRIDNPALGQLTAARALPLLNTCFSPGLILGHQCVSWQNVAQLRPGGHVDYKAIPIYFGRVSIYDIYHSIFFYAT